MAAAMRGEQEAGASAIRQQGDPARGARIILDTCADGPPLRVVPGGKAHPTIVGALKDKPADLAWSETNAPLPILSEGA